MKQLIIIFIIISVNDAISQEVLTNKSVYDLVEVGFESEIIIAKINSSECDFDTTVEGLKQLKSKKVPSEVILAMIENKKKKKKLDALIGGVSKSDVTTTGSEGNDNQIGDKGQLDGDPYAPSYFGNPGTGSRGVGYGLNGRGRATYDKIKQDCNESGLVIVRIVVNQNGNVVEALPGVKGTTNTAQCLLDPAKKIALSHKWRPDPNAPAKQIGFVKVNF
ncbi:hypothetical protein RXV94_11515 [Yeosuana sp. MJ-SS3]|uniref:Energy transducer TonB n=1 Tax=Gilvirhabdus luticola TaxID=3079858 RepID=A0ABU3U8S5_9FLAO|nr:hypothetical protein [Yeosuana sp. MJ-SS3]MDU8886790.1 hypothetical protein [Yeosuana sp. MJ-SS3]